MPQHYLLSADSRKLSLVKVARMSDEEARLTFAKLRWGSLEEQVCPRCGVVRKHAYISTRKQWACKDCSHRFLSLAALSLPITSCHCKPC